MNKPAICACGQALYAKNTSGKCRRCVLSFYTSDPATIAKRAEALRREAKTPAAQARRSVASSEVFSRPHVREAARRAGREYGKKNFTAEARSKGVVTRSAAQTGWCPAELRGEYARLRNTYGAAEARRILEEDIAAQARAEARRAVIERERATKRKHERDLQSQY